MAVLLLAFVHRSCLTHWRSELELWQYSVAVNDQDAIAWCNLGLALDQRGEDKTKALKGFQKSVELRPDDANCRSNVAATLSELGHLEEALDQYQQVVVLDPEHFDSWYSYGRLLHQTKRFKAALGVSFCFFLFRGFGFFPLMVTTRESNCA